MTMTLPNDFFFAHVSPLLSTCPHYFNELLTWIGSFLPRALVAGITNVGLLGIEILQRYGEARIILVLLLLPSFLLLSMMVILGLCISWPFFFPLSLCLLLALLSHYLFDAHSSPGTSIPWTSSSSSSNLDPETPSLSVGTWLFSLCFIVLSQCLLVLPVYFLAPLITFLALGAATSYLLYSALTQRSRSTSSYSSSSGSSSSSSSSSSLWQWSDYALLAVCLWWLLCTPYWSLIHFVSFPPLFLTSLLLQISLSSAYYLIYDSSLLSRLSAARDRDRDRDRNRDSHQDKDIQHHPAQERAQQKAHSQTSIQNGQAKHMNGNSQTLSHQHPSHTHPYPHHQTIVHVEHKDEESIQTNICDQ